MTDVNCLLSWHKNEIRKRNENISEFEIDIAARKHVRKECGLYPAFPDFDLVTVLSAQKYEKKECTSNLVFIPEKNINIIDSHYVLEFGDPVDFSRGNLRVIRKLLESVGNEQYCLVIVNKKTNKGCIQQAVGIAQIDELIKSLMVIIRIKGHMHWSAEIKDIPLFEYKDGDIQEIKPKFEFKEFESAFKEVFADEHQEDVMDRFRKIFNELVDLKHGTSIIIYDKKNYTDEMKRLTRPDVGHGVALVKDVFENNKNIKEIFKQVTKIDGGLFISSNGECMAIGCIFDGVVDDKFLGDNGRGSRYNSVKLYIHNKKKTVKCIGIIISEDGDITMVR